MTKRLICVFAALLLLSIPARAFWAGVLFLNQTITVTLTNPVGNPGAGATVCVLVPASKRSTGSDLVCHQLTAASTGTAAGVGTVVLTPQQQAGATRLIIFMDSTNPPSNVPLLLQVSQPAGPAFDFNITGDTRVTFDYQ